MKGNKKWKAKNLDSVGAPTEKPPQSQVTIESPKKGTAVNIEVITVAPQKDI